ncbi:MAG: rhomboid family intramembrane serine protease [Planctomycetota bacterium]|nr:rhomboid family intramembrane serine protease [Planctomycetota bacterium]
MTACPRCAAPLDERLTEVGIAYICPKCQGRMVGMPVLRNAGASEGFLRSLWSAARHEDAPRRLKCPHCLRPMSQVAAQARDGELEVDICCPCNAVWFDRKELDRVPHEIPDSALAAELPEKLPQKVREGLTVYDLQTDKQQALGERDLIEAVDPYEAGKGPAEWWQWLPGVFGMPIEIEPPERTGRPWLTWLIAGTVVAAFLVTVWDLEPIVKQWGFVPVLWEREGGLTLFTSFFLHAGIFHLAANMYFFIIFADNVEDSLGRPLLVVLLAAAHLAGLAGHTLFDPNGALPVIGASAGVSGVLGYYAVMFPRARLGYLFWWVLYVRWVQMPAYAALILFIVVQLVGASIEVSGFGGVAYVAHLAGLLVGILGAVLVRAAHKGASVQTAAS